MARHKQGCLSLRLTATARSLALRRAARRKYCIASVMEAMARNPYSGLIDVKGTLYGTTEIGGAHGYGTVFSLKP